MATKSASKSSLNNSIQRLAPTKDENVYEFLDDFTDDEQSPNHSSRSISKASSKASSKINQQSNKPNESLSKKSLSNYQPQQLNKQSDYNKNIQSQLIYLRIQAALVNTSLAITLIQLGLVIWMNVDSQFRFLAQISNLLTYSSIDKLFGLYPMAALALTSLALVLDLIQYGQFIFIKSYLRTREKEQKIRKRHVQLQRLIVYLKTYTLMTHLFYILIVLSLQFFIGSYLLVNLQLILNYQIPQTLIKLLRQYDVESTLEPTLIASMHRIFKCCHYQNPYQFGDLTPPECNQEQGCLRPIQEFTWLYLYISVILALSLAVLKFLVQLLFLLNFNLVLLGKVVRGLNDQHEWDEFDETEDLERLEGDQKLAEIRRIKEAKLAEEERLEEARKQQQLEEQRQREEIERKQDEYELMLFKQKRYDELRVEQMNRRLQLQHLGD